MKIVLSWLRDYLDYPADTTPEALAAALVQLGHEVDGIDAPSHNFTHVVVGRVMERVQHPNAERLGVCQVDVGEGRLRQIVCGAPNARAGITVAVALPGAVLPGDFKIGESKIRDVVSNGMICSVRELGLGDEHDGIWELATDVASGKPLSDVLGEPEIVLDVAVTPNRGDCLSHYGIARDLAALGMGTLKPLPELGLHEVASVPAVQAAIVGEACAQMNLIAVAGVGANVPSPALIQRRLQAAGQRPKNALVDVTTYVMLAIGQPLHAYDADKLQGRTLTATHAKNGQAFAGLTGINLTLSAEDVVVTDASGEALGLAGVLGGASTAITETTTNVVLEGAVWNPVQIAFTGQRHQIHTDAKARFERGIDSALAPYAVRYAAQLLQQWAGGDSHTLAGVLAQAGEGVKAPEPIRYHPAFFAKFIGVGVPDDKQRTILTALGFGIKEIQAGWLLTPPTWRTYMNNPEDITEEILRVVGYETVPHALPPTAAAQLGIAGQPITLDRKARKALAQSGFLEVITYSFIGAEQAHTYANANPELMTLANPLAQTDMTTLRPSLLPGVLNALAKNFAASDATPRLGEVGKVFKPTPQGSGEQLMAAGVLCATGGRHWQGALPTPDVFSAKAAVLQVLSALGVPVASGVWQAKAPAHYHPGRSGTFGIGPFVLAHVGELHPTQRAALDIPAVAGPLAVFEIYLEPLLKLTSKARPWVAHSFPPVKRDLSVLVPTTMPAAQVLGAVQQATRTLPPTLNVHAEVFDAYQGKGVSAGQVALGIALTLQNTEKTLAEADVQNVLGPIVASLTALGGVLREA